LSEKEKKERKKIERERKRQEARENAEKKKRFGLTPDKKRKLKLLIMQKATEDLKNEAAKKANAKKAYLDDRVKPLPELNPMNEGILLMIKSIIEYHRCILTYIYCFNSRLSIIM
jgi:hypothetical protein